MEPLDSAKITAQKFLAAWKASDWAAMLDCCQTTWVAKGGRDEQLQALQDLFGGYILVHYEVKQEPREAPSSMAFKLRLSTKLRCRPRVKRRQPPSECMVIQEIAPYQPSVEGCWGVNPLSLWHH